MINFLPPFLLGFLALSFQIFLLREFSVHFYGNEITFGLILACWLLWGGVGSISVSKAKFDTEKLPYIYYAIIILYPLSLVGLRFSRFILGHLPGEITGVISILIFSFSVTFLVSLPLGMLFVFNTHFQKGNLSRVYFLESAGSAFAGLVVYLVFIPVFPNWKGAAIIAASAAVLVFFSFGERKNRLFLIFILLYLTLFSLFDFPSQQIFWRPFHLVESRDTPYGKLQILRTQEQISLYNNTLINYSYPNLSAAEESVHFALLQKPEAERVLLVGGGVGGSLGEVLKYPHAQVDYVELNPEMIHLSLKYLPEEERQIFDDPRVQTFYQDGRAFLTQVQKKYQVVILNLPEPATAQINRFYTKEFFLLVKEKLTSGGVFSFRVPSAENYISAELQNFLSSLYFTLREVFPEVKIVPGDTNIFLASSSPLTIDSDKLSQRIIDLNLQTTYISPHLLFSRLNPLRISLLKDAVSEGRKIINLDFVPISYFYSSVLWSSQFRGLEKKIFTFLSHLSPRWLLDFPLAIFLCILVVLWIARRRSSFFLVPLAVMGFTTIVFEIMVIISFQTIFGYLYHRISLLLASFMIGLAAGALRGKKRKKFDFTRLLVIQSGFILVVLLFYVCLQISPPEILFFVFLFSVGFLGGDLFVVSNHLFLKLKKNYGLGYGLDLLGSFLGALAASSFLIPLVGLPLLLKYLFLFNSFCFLFLVGGLARR
ncbi:MAG: hypothetical protein ACLFVG_00310 [Candidatus Aminicenantes bacterium]